MEANSVVTFFVLPSGVFQFVQTGEGKLVSIDFIQNYNES
jgi:hypothetical protein